MDKDVLIAWLAKGLSLEAMGERAGRHPTDLAAILRAEGLRLPGAGRHRPRGGLDREVLAALVDRGLSLRAIGAEVDRSATTVRHWLNRYGLRTRAPVGRPAGSPSRPRLGPDVVAPCPVHGETPHRLGHDGGRRTGSGTTAAGAACAAGRRRCSRGAAG